VRRQYYLHHFLLSQPKLNLRENAVLAEHFATAEYWLGRGVDGFRFDAVDFMMHDPDLRVTGGWRGVRPSAREPLPDAAASLRHVHADTNRLMTGIRWFMNRFPDTTTIGELSSEPGASQRVAA